MERRKFLKSSCYSAIGVTLSASLLQSCGAIYYANATLENNRLQVAKTEFQRIKNDKVVNRTFILLKTDEMDYPICLYKTNDDEYTASLLKCTHNGCELNVGGGIYSCPCHGSEFSTFGKVLEGPAEKNLKTFNIETDHENIYINLY